MRFVFFLLLFILCLGAESLHQSVIMLETNINMQSLCCLNKRQLFSTCVLFLAFTVGTFRPLL